MSDAKSDVLKDQLTHSVIGLAIEVHRVLGPGLLESAYEECLFWELQQHGFAVERQTALPITYKEVRLDAGYRIDLWIQRELIVELKTVDALLPIHEAQLLSYLRLSNTRKGLLMNFHSVRLRDGVRRLVN